MTKNKRFIYLSNEMTKDKTFIYLSNEIEIELPRINEPTELKDIFKFEGETKETNYKKAIDLFITQSIINKPKNIFKSWIHALLELDIIHHYSNKIYVELLNREFELGITENTFKKESEQIDERTKDFIGLWDSSNDLLNSSNKVFFYLSNEQEPNEPTELKDIFKFEGETKETNYKKAKRMLYVISCVNKKYKYINKPKNIFKSWIHALLELDIIQYYSNKVYAELLNKEFELGITENTLKKKATDEVEKRTKDFIEKWREINHQFD